MKIAIASCKLEHIKRGVETWAKDTAHALYEKGINVRLYKGSGEIRQPYEKALWSIKEHTPLSVRLENIFPRSFWHIGFGFAEQTEETTFAWSLIKETWKEKFDIIHVQDAHVAEALQFANKIGLIKAKVILGHGTEEPFWFLKKFDYIQHLAPYHLEESTANCGHHKGWFAIGNFIYTDRFTPGENIALRKELDIPQDAFVILSVAAIKTFHKRVDYLIKEAAALVTAGHRNVYLVVSGGRTQDSDALMAFAQKELDHHVRFLVNQSHEKMPEIHKVADVFALCSLKEMMPIALLEAISSGVPALVHKYPVEEWMVGEGGEALDMSKEGELAEVIKKYFDADYRNRRAIKARAHAVEHFSMDVIIGKYIEMYEKILKIEGRPRDK